MRFLIAFYLLNIKFLKLIFFKHAEFTDYCYVLNSALRFCWTAQQCFMHVFSKIL